jgi:hypothetical protein
MRIVVSAPRKSGGAHLRCLLSMAYDLKAPSVSAPQSDVAGAISEWLSNLPDRSVSTCDLPYAVLATAAADADVRLIGVIRHPFDLFVSNFDVAQQRAARGREDTEGDRPWSILAGQELDGDVTREYATGGFGDEIATLRDWAAAGVAVRYEDLLRDPASALRALAGSLGTLSDDQVEHATVLCPAENVVLSRPGRGRRMPSLPPGAWRDRLPDLLLQTLREKYGGDVTALGYESS